MKSSSWSSSGFICTIVRVGEVVGHYAHSLVEDEVTEGYCSHQGAQSKNGHDYYIRKK